MYNCPGGVLLVAAPRCVGPECRGGPKGGGPTIGYAGDLDAGSRGAFFQAGRVIGTTALDGVEIQKGLSAIDELRTNGSIDGYYASAAKRAYLERIGDMPERAAPFEEPSPFGTPLAPSAIMRGFTPRHGAPVGPSVREGCACTPRKPDARDPVSGWLIYYVPGGVLLTPTEKCVAGGAGRPGFLATTWRNILALSPTMPKQKEPPLEESPIIPPSPAPAAAPVPPKPDQFANQVTPGGLYLMVAPTGGTRMVIGYDVPKYLALGYRFA